MSSQGTGVLPTGGVREADSDLTADLDLRLAGGARTETRCRVSRIEV